MQKLSDRIVVGVDDSRGGRAALRYALHDAARRGAAVEIVSVFAPVDLWAGSAIYGVAVSPAAETEQLREATRVRIQQLVDEVVEDETVAFGMRPRVSLTVVAGSPTSALLEASAGADLLVVGHRGRGGFTSALLGSVSLQCVLHASIPVTVVRPVVAAERAGRPTVGAATAG